VDAQQAEAWQQETEVYLASQPLHRRLLQRPAGAQSVAFASQRHMELLMARPGPRSTLPTSVPVVVEPVMPEPEAIMPEPVAAEPTGYAAYMASRNAQANAATAMESSGENAHMAQQPLGPRDQTKPEEEPEEVYRRQPGRFGMESFRSQDNFRPPSRQGPAGPAPGGGSRSARVPRDGMTASEGGLMFW